MNRSEFLELGLGATTAALALPVAGRRLASSSKGPAAAPCLARFDRLMRLAAERRLDVCPVYIEQATLAGVEAGVSWHTWWESHDIDRKFQFAELEYDQGLLTLDNRPKDRTRAFKAVADAT